MKKVVKARSGLVLDEPFFGTLALRLKLIECEAPEVFGKPMKTFATDGTDIYFFKDFVNEISLSQTKAVLAHEIMHLALAHHARFNNRVPEKWNYATDYVINPILKDAGFDLPDWALFKQEYAGKCAEEVYNLIPDLPQGKNGGSGGDGASGSQADPGRMGSVIQPNGKDGKPSAAEIAKSEQDWKIAVAQAAKMAKAQGKLPGSMAGLIDGILEPKVNWKDVLRQFVEQSIKNDYSWLQPNRRYINQGFYLPSLDGKCIGDISIAVDTSGSVSQPELTRFASEISAILNEFPGIGADVYYIDTQIASQERFESDDLPIELHAAGGGGTNFAPVFDHIDLEDEHPVCLLYFSDMCCNSYPDHLPDYPVMWINTSHNLPYGDPPFGQVLDIDVT